MENKISKKSIILIYFLLIFIIAVFVFIYVYNVLIQISKENEKYFSENIKSPDRIIYKSEEKYYEFLYGTDEYNQIIKLASTMLDENENQKEIKQFEVDAIHEKNFIEFDYNTASKNYIISFDGNYSFIKLKKYGAIVLKDELKKTEKLKELVDELSESRKFYTMSNTKTYTSNFFQEYASNEYVENMENKDGGIKQQKINSKEELNNFIKALNLNFKEPIPENIYEENNVILTLYFNKSVDVKLNIGSIYYTFDKISEYKPFAVNVVVVSKVVNSNCIYINDLYTQKQEQEVQELDNSYNERIENLNPDIFVKDFETYFAERKDENKNITQKEAELVADKAFTEYEGERVDTLYPDVSIKREKVYANNTFTRKSGEYDCVYNETEKIDSYCITRENDIGCGLTICVDIKTGKVIAGNYFGD